MDRHQVKVQVAERAVGSVDCQSEQASHSLRGGFEQLLHHASLVVLQQCEAEAVLTGPIHRLHLHQRAVGVVQDHKTLCAAPHTQTQTHSLFVSS